jgi:hypothetical protein
VKGLDVMNIGERIALLQGELKFEDERQEVLYAEFQRLCDSWPDDMEKTLSYDDRQELIRLNFPLCVDVKSRISYTVILLSKFF